MDGWARFGIDETVRSELELHCRLVARRLTDDEDEREDVVQAMWAKCLDLRRQRADYPVGWLKGAMEWAAWDCLERVVVDGPYEGRRRAWWRLSSYDDEPVGECG